MCCQSSRSALTFISVMDWGCNLTLNEYNVHGDLLISRSSVEHARPEGMYSRYSTFTSRSHSVTDNGLHKAHRKHFQHLRPFSLFAPLASHGYHGNEEKSYLHNSHHSSNFRMHQYPRHSAFNSRPGRWCAVHGKIAWNIHFKKQMRRQLEPKFYSFHHNISHRRRDLSHVFSTQFFSANDHHHQGYLHLKPLLAERHSTRRHHEYRKVSASRGEHDPHSRSGHNHFGPAKGSSLHLKEGKCEHDGTKDGPLDSIRTSKKHQRETVGCDQSGKHSNPAEGPANQSPSHRSQHNYRIATAASNHTAAFPVPPQKSENLFYHSGAACDSGHSRRRRSTGVHRSPFIPCEDIKREPSHFQPMFVHASGNGISQDNFHSPPWASKSSPSTDDKDEELGKGGLADLGMQRSDCRDRINFNCQSLDHVSAFSVVNNSLLDLERMTQSSSSDSSTTSCFESFKTKLDTRYVKNFQTISNLLPEPRGCLDGASSQNGRASRKTSPLKREYYRKCRKAPVEDACDSRCCHKLDVCKADEFLPVGRFDVIGHKGADGASGSSSSSSSENKNKVVCPKGSGGSESSWTSDLSCPSVNRSESEGNSSGSLSSNESPTMDNGKEKHRKGAKHHL